MPPFFDSNGGGGSDVEAQLAAEQERAYAQAVAEQQAREREERRQKLARQIMKNPETRAAVNMAKTEAKAMFKTGVKAGTRLIWVEIIVPLLPYIGAALAVIAGFIAMIAIVVMAVAWQCNATGLQGWLARASSTLAHTLGYTSDFDICKELHINTSAIAEQTVAPPDQNTGIALVAITGVPVDAVSTSDPRLRPCMLVRLQNIYTKAQLQGIYFEVTSANRPGAQVGDTDTLSAHSRGEAVDIALRPIGNWRTDPVFAKKIDRLVEISMNEGFRPLQGDTLDEYRKPTVSATGGHIHIEFNLAANGNSYCNAAL